MTWISGTGAGIVALCCVTSVLPVLLGALGVSVLTPMLYRDVVLLPLLGLFLILTGAGIWLTKRKSG
jgi:mercuric ion transport protein